MKRFALLPAVVCLSFSICHTELFHPSSCASAQPPAENRGTSPEPTSAGQSAAQETESPVRDLPGVNALPVGQPAEALTQPQAEAVAERITDEVTRTIDRLKDQGDRLIALQIESFPQKSIVPAEARSVVVQALQAGSVKDAVEILDRHHSDGLPPELLAVLDDQATMCSQLTSLLTKVHLGVTSIQLRPQLQQTKLAVAKVMGVGEPTAVLDGVRSMLDVRDVLRKAVLPNPFAPDLGAVLSVGWVTVITYPDAPADMLRVAGKRFVVMGGEGMTVGAAEMTSAEALGLRAIDGEPVPAAGEQEVTDGILLRNPIDSGADANYTIGKAPASLEPGSERVLDAEHERRIRFDRGGERGNAYYALRKGTYTFTAQPNGGWELFRNNFRIVIDNADNPLVFYYQVDDTEYELAAGASREHISDHPIHVSFDACNGSRSLRKNIDENGKYFVAVNLRGNHWDLFAEATVAAAAHRPARNVASDHAREAPSVVRFAY